MLKFRSLDPLRQGLTRLSQQLNGSRSNLSISSADSLPGEEDTKATTAASALAYFLEKLQICNSASRTYDLPDVSDPSAYRYWAQIGVPVESSLVPKYDISVFKPQIVFQSDMPDDDGVIGDSVLLVAADRVVIRSYDILDAGSEHRASEPILSR